MAFGFQIFGPTGALQLSSDSLPAMIKDIIQLSGGVAGSASYPDIVGYSLFYTQVTASFGFFNGFAPGETLNGISIAYANGVPTISWDSGGNMPSLLYVFAQ